MLIPHRIGELCRIFILQPYFQEQVQLNTRGYNVIEIEKIHYIANDVRIMGNLTNLTYLNKPMEPVGMENCRQYVVRNNPFELMVVACW